MLGQANHLVDCAEEIVNTAKHSNCNGHAGTTHLHKAARDASLPGDVAYNDNELSELMKLLQHNVQYSCKCIDVVDDDHLLLSAEEQPNHASQDRHKALEQLRQAGDALKVLSLCVQEST